MKKFIIAFSLSILLLGTTKVYAMTVQETVNYLRQEGYTFIASIHGYPQMTGNNNYILLYYGNTQPTFNKYSSNPDRYEVRPTIGYYTFRPYNSDAPSHTSYPYMDWTDDASHPLTLYSADANVEYPDNVIISNDFQNTGDPLPEPKWYEDAWDIFKAWLGNTPWDDNNIVTMISDFWKKWTNGDNEPDDINIIGYSTPTPQPTPTPKPTPIPYSVSLIDINGGQEIIYNYVDPTSGLPTSSPYNPNIDITIQGGGSSTTITTPVPVILATGTPEFQNILFTSEDSNDLEINVGQIGEYVDVIENGLIENTAAMEEVSNIFSILPNNWFMIIGIIACIPIIAAVISRFLH